MNEKFVEELGKLGVECILVNLVKISIANCILNSNMSDIFLKEKVSRNRLKAEL